jgi:hypothetical protein
MIRFACRCGHTFEEPDEAAGSGVQCPRCMLLNDVPRLGELPSIKGDGTYEVGQSLSTPRPDAAENLIQTFAKTKVDGEGNPIDLRGPAEALEDVGAYETVEQLQRRQRPRYDPETGDLLTPIPLAAATEQTRAPEVPFAKPALDYAPDPKPLGSVFVQLIQPYNLVVMFFVFCVCLLGGMTGIVVVARLYFFLPVILAIAIVLMAHYGNVVNEIGVEDRDELPRVLGDFRFHEDVLLPAAAAATAGVICYGVPALLFFVPLPIAMAAALASLLAVFATYFFPAILLTLLSSGSISNLRPDRVLAVIHRDRRGYLRIVALFVGALACSALAMASLIVEAMRMAFISVNAPAGATNLLIGLPLLVLSIFVTHQFCWNLGLYYRRNHPFFPWVGRFHEQKPRPPVVRRKPRYVPQPRDGG